MMVKCICFASLVWISFYASLWADTYNPSVKLGPFVGSLKFERGMVATGHRLWGCEIVGQDLRDAKFDDCDLGGVAFRQCEFAGATFRRAVLTGMIVDDCSWENNDFIDAVINGIVKTYDGDKTGVTPMNLVTTWSYKNKNLSKCYLVFDKGDRMELNGCDLSEAHLVRASNLSFVKSKLFRTTLEFCDLTTCDFSGARLIECTFKYSKFDYIQMKSSCNVLADTFFLGESFVSEMDVSDSIFGARPLMASNPEFIKLSNPELIKLRDTNIFGITTNVLNSSNLVTTKSYKIGEMVNMTLIRCDFSGVDFSRQVLVNTMFEACKFDGCKFDDAVITNTSFRNCTGLTEEQIDETWNARANRMESVKLIR
jgi:uncharacterized protein YjbI with pentapeptide repeats